MQPVTGRGSCNLLEILKSNKALTFTGFLATYIPCHRSWNLLKSPFATATLAMHLLRFLLIGLQTATMAAAACVGARSVADDLQSLVPASSVAVQVRERWSEVDAPVATVIFNATSEKDISEVVC